jgi:hypothetical protein
MDKFDSLAHSIVLCCELVGLERGCLTRELSPHWTFRRDKASALSWLAAPQSWPIDHCLALMRLTQLYTIPDSFRSQAILLRVLVFQYFDHGITVRAG